jgi:hypothetical protein
MLPPDQRAQEGYTDDLLAGHDRWSCHGGCSWHGHSSWSRSRGHSRHWRDYRGAGGGHRYYGHCC